MDNPPLDHAKVLGARESGLAVAVTTRADGTPRASVVNAGVLEHPMISEPIVGFVSPGATRKLDDLRHRPQVTVVFRSGWEWIAVEGDATLLGPDDNPDGPTNAHLIGTRRLVYAAAVGGTPDEWAALDQTLATERHTAVLVRPRRTYPSAGP